MEEIKLILDDELLDEYAEYYFSLHPKALYRSIKKPRYPSVNEWMIMKRPEMNALKQKWKDFGVWWMNKMGYNDMKLDNFEMIITVYFDTRRRVDPDNQIPKGLLDSFTSAGFIVDDSSKHLHSLTLRCDYDKEWPRTEILIKVLDKKEE